MLILSPVRIGLKIFGHAAMRLRGYAAPGGHFDGPEAQNLDLCCIFTGKLRIWGAQGAPDLRELSVVKHGSGGQAH